MTRWLSIHSVISTSPTKATALFRKLLNWKRFNVRHRRCKSEGLVFDSSGNLYVANEGSSYGLKITSGGSASTFATVGSGPNALAFDSSGNLYVANYGGTVSKVTPGGIVSTFATVGGTPIALAFDPYGNLYVANESGNTISEVTPSGTVTTFASPNGPWALAFDSGGNLYAANFGNGTVSKFTFTAGDTLTADNIDQPLGTGLGATTNPDASKTITFTPSSPGTYTFYGRATTGYYPSWTAYASTTVSVTAGPACSISLSPSAISPNQSSTLTYASSGATSFSISGVGTETPDSTSSTQVSPTTTTTYTGTAGANTATSTCSSDAQCLLRPYLHLFRQHHSVHQLLLSGLKRCCVRFSAVLPSRLFSSCLAPAITFNQQGEYTGDLQLVPNILQSGEVTQVHWSVSDAQSCTVTGTNGDSWTGLSSPTNGETSKPITAQTTYTLSCTAYGSNPNVAVKPSLAERDTLVRGEVNLFTVIILR